MKVKTMNPFEGRGKRSVFCPYYSECLDLVIGKSWIQWDCSKCEQRFNNEEESGILRTVDYSIAYYELLRET
jgi:hypothetical protein